MTSKPRPGTLAAKLGDRGLIAIALVLAAAMVGGGAFLIVQRETGPRALAKVGDCVTTGSGKYMRTHCTGTWVVGGALTEGGHVVFGTINGVDRGDVGKTIDVTLRGDTAYSRDLVLPLLLIGLGLVPAFGAWSRWRALSRARALR